MEEKMSSIAKRICNHPLYSRATAWDGQVSCHTRDVVSAAVAFNCKDREKDPPSINHTFMTDVCVKMLDEVPREVLELPPRHCG